MMLARGRVSGPRKVDLLKGSVIRRGNTLVLKEVERLLREGKAVGSKELAEYLEVEGYARAAQWVYAQAVDQPPDWSAGERINLTELRQIHRLAVEPAASHAPPEGLH